MTRMSEPQQTKTHKENRDDAEQWPIRNLDMILLPNQQHKTKDSTAGFNRSSLQHEGSGSLNTIDLGFSFFCGKLSLKPTDNRLPDSQTNPSEQPCYGTAL